KKAAARVNGQGGEDTLRATPVPFLYRAPFGRTAGHSIRADGTHGERAKGRDRKPAHALGCRSAAVRLRRSRWAGSSHCLLLVLPVVTSAAKSPQPVPASSFRGLRGLAAASTNMKGRAPNGPSVHLSHAGSDQDLSGQPQGPGEHQPVVLSGRQAW